MSGAYYNENDPVAAEWLRRLIAAGLVAPGEVDERDIRDVAPDDLLGFTQCHFFAGIGIWSGALRAAGWSDDDRLWTGSCPCQPFSASGAREGFADERHLWPHWHWLIAHRRPRIVLGEQVASQDGLRWNDLVSADMAATGYAFASVDLAAGGFGLGWRGSAYEAWLERALHDCPDPMVARQLRNFADWARESLAIGGLHIRQRQYFVGVGDSDREGDGGGRDDGPREGDGAGQGAALERSTGLRSAGALAGRHSGLGDAHGARAPAGLPEPAERQEGRPEIADHGGDRLSGPRAGGPGAQGLEPLGLPDPGRGGVQSGDRPGGERPAARSDEGAARQRQRGGQDDPASGASGQLGDPEHLRCDEGDARDPRAAKGPGRERGDEPDRSGGDDRPGQADERRSPFDWLLCRDGVWRATRPGTFPLAHAVAGRVGKLRAYGNGLDFETATDFCRTVREMRDAGEL